MINTGVLREVDNASVGPKIIKLTASEQKPRLKTKALGDVQNTLHSRFGNFINSNTGPTKSSLDLKCATSDKALSGKSTTSGRKINVTPAKSTRKVPSPTDVDYTREIHNHILCEQEEEICVSNFFEDYKFSEEQINRLVRSAKSFVTSAPATVFEPCEDIEMFDVKTFQEDSFSVEDIFSDLITLPVPAPIDLQ